MRPGAPSVFVSYSHKDERWKDRMLAHLGVLAHEGMITTWSDRDLTAGEGWRHAIERQIEKAHVAVLLVSQHFLTSKFILENEVPSFLMRQAQEGLMVIPVIVRSCAWQNVEWLARLQIRPTDGQPLTSRGGDWPDRMLTGIAQEIVRNLPALRPGRAAALAPASSANATVPVAAEWPVVRPAKKCAILDRRLVNELLVAFSGPNAGWLRVPAESRAAVMQGLAHYDRLLVENVYASTLHEMIFANEAVPQALRDRLLVTAPVEGEPFMLKAMAQAGELLMWDPAFTLALAAYGKAKRGGGFPSSEAAYLFHNLRFAASVDAAVLAHPQRWPLYEACFSRCVQRSAPGFEDVSIALPPAAALGERLVQLVPDWPTTAPLEGWPAMVLRQIGPCPFPYPQELLRICDPADLAALPASRFEFCVPQQA